MRLSDINKDGNVIKFPGKNSVTERDRSLDEANIISILDRVRKLGAAKQEQPERGQKVWIGLTNRFGDDIARFASLLFHLVELESEDQQFVDLALSRKWDGVREDFLKRFDEIERTIRGILTSNINARAAELGLKVIK